MSDTPAEQFMMLRALQAGLEAARDRVEERLNEFRELHRTKSFDTRFGLLVRTVTKPSVQVGDVGLLDWLKVNLPGEVKPGWVETIHHPETVRPTAKGAVLKRAVIDGDVVVDSETGEVLPFAKVRPGSEHWTAKLTDEAKANAGNVILERLENVTAMLEPPRE